MLDDYLLVQIFYPSKYYQITKLKNKNSIAINIVAKNPKSVSWYIN